MTSTRIEPAYDAVIVGARCAGAATAMLLARSGLSVLVIERGVYGSDTLSTHALMRGGVVQLARWGLLPAIQNAHTPPIRHVTFHYGDDAIGVAVKDRDGVNALYATRRTLLDAALVDEARHAGATIVHGPRVTALSRARDGRVTGVAVEQEPGRTIAVRADIVIGADGWKSSVARWAGAGPYRAGTGASGVAYGYWAGMRLDGYHWHFREGVAAGAIPSNGGLTCVFVAVPSRAFGAYFWPDPLAGHRRALDQASRELGGAVDAATRLGRLQGFVGQPGRFMQSWGPGWALVGDAGYYTDPLSAHGITDALRDAELLARAVTSGDARALERYQDERDALAIEVFEAANRIASFDWNLDTLRVLHHDMNGAFGREATHLADWKGDIVGRLATRT